MKMPNVIDNNVEVCHSFFFGSSCTAVLIKHCFYWSLLVPFSAAVRNYLLRFIMRKWQCLAFYVYGYVCTQDIKCGNSIYCIYIV